MSRIAWVVVFLLSQGCRQRVDVAGETDALLRTDRAWAEVAATGHSPDSVLAYWADGDLA
jgi:hypothetical protein